jgi:hypothetical protein
MVNRSAALLAAEDGPFTTIRVGVVSAATANQVIVLVGGSSVPASWVAPFGVTNPAPPVLGDLVVVLVQDASWTVIGRVAGAGANQVDNPSFEIVTTGDFPDGWFSADLTGTSVVFVEEMDNAPDGENVALVSTDSASASHYLYSSPISVAPGEQWAVSAYVGGDIALTADAALYGLWFANATDLYPTTSAADTSIATLNNVPQSPPFQTLSGTVTVPAATTHMRVALRSAITPDSPLRWDLVLARRVA